MRKFLIIFMCLIFAGLVTSTTVLAVKYSAEINKTEETQPTDTSGLVNTIEELQKLVKDLTAEKSELQVKADKLTTQNESLQAQISALQSQLDVDADAIQNLQQQLADNEALINDLNSQITALENSITYYEDYIQRFENENQVTATFVVDNEVVATPILLIGDKLTPPAVESTETKTFDGWLVNDELIDIDTYTISEDTRFVAKFSYSYYATFMSDDIQVHEVLIPEGEPLGNYLPVDPTKEGYNFLYWSIDNVELAADYLVSQDITIYATFEEWVRNGTYKFVLWHPNLTVQGLFTLSGNNVVCDELNVTDCNKSNAFIDSITTNFIFEYGSDYTNRLKISFYVKSGTKYFFKCTVHILFDPIYSNSSSIALKSIDYYSSGTTDKNSTSYSDISSGTTITFKEVV